MLRAGVRRGFWCECWTEDVDSGRGPFLLASFDAGSAQQADQWVAVTLRTITPMLDPEASDEAWEWLYDGRVDTRQALLRTEPCTVTVTQAHTRVTWTIRPALFLPLAHRQDAELPSCAYDFKPQQSVSSLS
ncbi:hypothetical protein GA0115233_10456 [Streptomyces sp. DI166]|uniref:hypothetical protein n=1 Tax=Streptomyces sp. DI166 TaxID=1839783 RepID=UPI0007F4AAB0|nr:hypothetical protein [Streptomyces sp. DI166]SBT92426.1 hypothetical protein GA0115233_10456 [Streptomyces sp. DI166]